MAIVSNHVPQDQLRLLGYWSQLDAIYRGFNNAARDIELQTGVPICVPGCGRCCMQSVHAHGIEAEYAGSLILGSLGKRPGLLSEVLDRCREWLTREGNWTYSRGWFGTIDLSNEYRRAFQERCCFLTDDLECLIYDARPMVCRAFGVTHLPGLDCPRPLGVGEDQSARAIVTYDTPANPLRAMVDRLLKSIREPRYNRQGFFATFLFERFRARELAGLIYDGKVPLVKQMVGWGGGYKLLWQDQFDREWELAQVDQSIDEEVSVKDSSSGVVIGLNIAER
jgi:Fe-S-cluster containining protein